MFQLQVPYVPRGQWDHTTQQRTLLQALVELWENDDGAINVQL